MGARGAQRRRRQYKPTGRIGGYDYFPIEKDVPIPEPSKGGRVDVHRKCVPWHKMEIGDSVLVPDVSRAYGSKLVQGAHDRLPDYRFVSRMTPEGIRIWRVT